jgi:hypothetical protein
MNAAKAHVDRIRREIEESRGSRLWRDSINMLNTVSESIFSRSAHFILELLQNAEDAGPKGAYPKGKIEFTISPSRIKITHNGSPFSEQNVDAVCGVRSTKQPSEGTLGFLGIGFKSVFKITDRPQIHSGPFHFKFDKAAFDDPPSVPWQIMPIWDEPSEPIDTTPTTFILPFRSDELYHQTLEELKKIDVHVFLFLKWMVSLKIIDEGGGSPILVENLGESDDFLTLTKNGDQQRFVIFRRLCAVPSEVAADPALVFYKRQHVPRREVVIAFAVDNQGHLRPIEDASALGSVSSFLPLVEERSGAKFLIQADFLVQPGREAIQYEMAWNRWLVHEAVEAAKDAINRFKDDQRWEKQFLPLFNFTAYPGQAAYERLFKPQLRDPLLAYLRSEEVFATASGGHISADRLVHPEDGLKGLLEDSDLSLLFPGSADLKLLDPSVDFNAVPAEIRGPVREVKLDDVARNRNLLETRSTRTEWLQTVYRAMAGTNRSFRQSLRQGSRGRFTWVEDPIFVPTETNEMLSAKSVHLRQVPPAVANLRNQFKEVDELLSSYNFLHPCLDDEELGNFFTEHTHVERIDYETICRSVFLPKVRITVPAPPVAELIAYTRLLQKGPPVSGPIWALNKRGLPKRSDELFMGSAWSPAENWEKNAKFIPEIDFLSPIYLSLVPPDEVPGWKEFFVSLGVKQAGERNHVELFAMAFVEDQLASELSDFVPKHRSQVGYDREATRKTDEAMVRLEIKGMKQEQPVSLVGKEPGAAQAAANNGEPFWVCVVPGIPEEPQLWVAEDVLNAGSLDTLTLDVSKWRTFGRREI